MRKRRFPWGTLAVAFAVSLAAGWMLAKPERTRGPQIPRHRATPREAAPLAPRTPAPTRDVARTVAPSQPQAQTAATPLPLASVPALATVAPVQSQAPGGVPRLAIIIDDCGQWLDTERALIALPIPLTVSIMPHAPYTSVVEQAAADAGQGIMLHLPMEPRSGISAGDGEVTTAMDDRTVAALVREDLNRVPLARGVNNHEGSRATADARVMHDVAQVLAAEGRYFVDSRTTASTVAATEAEALDVPTASRNVFLDNVASVAAIDAQLEVAAQIARQRGSAIAIGHPKPAMLEALRAAIPRIQREGVTFALAQDLVTAPPASAATPIATRPSATPTP